MKKFFTKNNIKYIAVTCFVALIIGSIFGIASLFLGNKNENKNEVETPSYDEFISFSIENEIQRQNLNPLLSIENDQLFSKENVSKNIIKISKIAIDNCDDFKSENINDYQIKLRYFLSDDYKDLKINIFMYNKLLKNKKFKTFYRIYII